MTLRGDFDQGENPAASGNLNSNNGSARPDSVDMAEAMALMADAGDDAGPLRYGRSGSRRMPRGRTE